MTDQAGARRSPSREEIASIVKDARKLVAAHESRNPTSERATLGEEDALFNLAWSLHQVQVAVRV